MSSSNCCMKLLLSENIMSKFKFVSENRPFVDGDVSITTKEFDAEYLYDVLSEFENFLRGCGYVFRGQLDFVEDDEETFDDEEDLDFSTPLFDDTITITSSSRTKKNAK